MKLLFDRLNQTLTHAMDLRLERGNVIASNLANIDTPDFTPMELDFDKSLQDFLAGDREVAPRGELGFDFYALPNADGNSVDLDHEMVRVSENQLMYRATTRFYQKRSALMRYAITGGGR